MKSIGELIATLDLKAKDIDPNFVGFDNIIPTNAWESHQGVAWRSANPAPGNPALTVFFIAPQDDGMVNVYCYPNTEKDKDGRMVNFTRYVWFDPPSGLNKDIRTPLQMEIMSSDNWIAELVEEALAHSDVIIDRDAARNDGEDEAPEGDDAEETSVIHIADNMRNDVKPS